MPDYMPFTDAGLGQNKLSQNKLSNDARRRIANAMLQNGIEPSPGQSLSQGAARVVNALVGGMRNQEQDSQDGVGLDSAGLDDVIKVQGGEAQGGKNQGEVSRAAAPSAMPPLQAVAEAAMPAPQQDVSVPNPISPAPAQNANLDQVNGPPAPAEPEGFLANAIDAAKKSLLDFAAETGKARAAEEPADHGLSERQKMSPVQLAMNPITSYWPTYSRMNRESADKMFDGVNQIRNSSGAWDTTKGVGTTVLGGLGYAASPISAAYRTMIGQPIEDVTRIPREYTEFAAQLATPGIGFPRLGTPAPNVAKLSDTEGLAALALAVRNFQRNEGRALSQLFKARGSNTHTDDQDPNSKRIRDR